MRRTDIHDAAYAVVNGGIGFVPIPPDCPEKTSFMLAELARLGRLRQEGAIKEHAWGYEPDHKGQYDGGLSQYRTDERKDVFHFEPKTRDILASQGAPVHEWDDFFRAQAESWYALYRLTDELMRAFEQLMPERGIYDSFKSFGLRHPNRGLVYARRRGNDVETATPHTDRAFVSLHHSETGPGFFVIPHDTQERLRLHIPKGYAAVFPGLKFYKMTGGLVRPIVHGTYEVPACEPDGRRASVFFAHTAIAHL